MRYDPGEQPQLACLLHLRPLLLQHQGYLGEVSAPVFEGHEQHYFIFARLVVNRFGDGRFWKWNLRQHFKNWKRVDYVEMNWIIAQH